MSWRSNTVAFTLCLASLLGTASTAAASEFNKTIDLWMNEAPLSHVIHQLAELSGGKASITGALEGEVSGRFHGTVVQTLETLSEEHDILFDLQDDTLHVTSKRARSEVSMVMAGAELNDTLKSSVQSVLMPGNEIEIQDELVKLSGHPDFVKRTARRLAAELAITRVKEIEMAAQLEAPIANAEVEQIAVTIPAEPKVTEMAEQVSAPEQTSNKVENTALTKASKAVEIPTVAPDAKVFPETTIADVTDAGSEALLADIADEPEVESDDITKTDSFRWVTDIPGFSTF